MLRMKVVIIGTAGRGDDAQRLTPHIWQRMTEHASQKVSKLCSDDWSLVELISGGAAWAGTLSLHHMLSYGLNVMTRPRRRTFTPAASTIEFDAPFPMRI